MINQMKEERGFLGVDRRTFLKGGLVSVLTVGGVAIVGDWLDITTSPDKATVPLARGAIIVNKDICAGCRTCEAVCSNFNSQGRNSASLSRIMVRKEYIEGDYQPKVCYQCVKPVCLEACPVSALQFDKRLGTNARVINERACIGCRKCEEACAQYFDPPRPRFDAEKQVEMKCHLCFGDPQCVRYCPTRALRYEFFDSGIKTGYPVIEEV